MPLILNVILIAGVLGNPVRFFEVAVVVPEGHSSLLLVVATGFFLRPLVEVHLPRLIKLEPLEVRDVVVHLRVDSDHLLAVSRSEFPRDTSDRSRAQIFAMVHSEHAFCLQMLLDLIQSAWQLVNDHVVVAEGLARERSVFMVPEHFDLPVLVLAQFGLFVVPAHSSIDLAHVIRKADGREVERAYLEDAAYRIGRPLNFTSNGIRFDDVLYLMERVYR